MLTFLFYSILLIWVYRWKQKKFRLFLLKSVIKSEFFLRKFEKIDRISKKKYVHITAQWIIVIHVRCPLYGGDYVLTREPKFLQSNFIKTNGPVPIQERYVYCLSTNDRDRKNGAVIGWIGTRVAAKRRTN